VITVRGNHPRLPGVPSTTRDTSAATLERLQVLQAEHDGGRTAVLGDDHSAVLVFEAVNDL
jgi:hypothetical protein